jgi:hypothetical protein
MNNVNDRNLQDDIMIGATGANQAEEVEQDKLHPCPACESCTKERFPDRCTCFRMCPYYRCWLARIWRMVTAPLRRAPRPHLQSEGGDAT